MPITRLHQTQTSTGASSTIWLTLTGWVQLFVPVAVVLRLYGFPFDDMIHRPSPMLNNAAFHQSVYEYRSGGGISDKWGKWLEGYDS